MEVLLTDREIADIIILELVNEAQFEKYINCERFIGAYYKGEISFKALAIRLRQPQNKHHRVNEHTYHLRDQSEDVLYLVAVGIIEHYWEQYHSTPFGRWDIPPEARHLYEMPEEATPVVEVDMEEIELRVLSKYADYANQATQKVDAIFNRDRTVNDIKDCFQSFKHGRWAWNTVRGKLEGHLGVRRQNRSDEVVALTNIFALKFYSRFFDDLYGRPFTACDVPPQCRYLFEPKEFEENGWLDTPLARGETNLHDDHIDASAFLKQSAELIFQKQFTTLKEKEITMNKIETKTFINDEDATTLSDDTIFSLIARTEKDIEKLEAIKEKPKKLTNKIKAMQESITELVKIVDERD